MDKLLVTNNDFCFGKLNPDFTIIFHGNDHKEVGRLYIENGAIKFKGDIDESAELFFENMVKKHNNITNNYKDALEWISRVNATDDEYQKVARAALCNSDK